jgi:hypothetical protein
MNAVNLSYIFRLSHRWSSKKRIVDDPDDIRRLLLKEEMPAFEMMNDTHSFCMFFPPIALLLREIVFLPQRNRDIIIEWLDHRCLCFRFYNSKVIFNQRKEQP